MAIQLRGKRSNITLNLSATFVAIFALVAQPLVALNLPAAFAAENSEIKNMTLISESNDFDKDDVQIVKGKLSTVKVDVQPMDGLDEKATVEFTGPQSATLTLARKTANGYEMTSAQDSKKFAEGLYNAKAVIKQGGEVVDTYSTSVRVDNVLDSHAVTNVVPSAADTPVSGNVTPQATVENSETVDNVRMNIFKSGTPTRVTTMNLVFRNGNTWTKYAESSKDLPNGQYDTKVDVTDVYGAVTTTSHGTFTIKNDNPTTFSDVVPVPGSTVSGTIYPSAVAKDADVVDTVTMYAYKQGTDDVITMPLTLKSGDKWYRHQLDTKRTADGQYDIVVKAVDADGNTSWYNQNRELSPVTVDNTTVDNAAPRVSNVEIIGQDDATGNIGGTVTVAFNMEDASEPDASRTRVIFGNTKTVDDNHKREAVMNPVYNADTGKYEATFNTKSFVSSNHTGTYTLGINPYDKLGNQTSIKPEAFRNLLVDNSGPGFSVQSPAKGAAVNGEVTVVFNAKDDTGVSGGYARLINENGKTVRQQNIQPDDNGTWTATFDTDGLDDGTYTIDARPKDTFGTERYNKNRGSIVVDNTKPTHTIDSHSAGDRVNGEFSLEGTATDNLSGIKKVTVQVNKLDADGNHDSVQLSRQDVQYSDGSWSFEVDTSSFDDGTYRFHVNSVDNADNERHAPNVDLVVDNTLPGASAGDDQTVTGRAATIRGSSDDSGATYSWAQTDGPGATTFADNSASGTGITVDEYGTYTYELTVTDQAGNASTDTVQVTFNEPVESEGEEETLATGQPTQTTSTDSATEGGPVLPITPLQNAAQQPPLAFFGNNAGNPGAQADADDTTDEDDQGVLSAEDNAQDGEVTRDAAASEVLGDEDEKECWDILGLCWYWWIPIVAAVVGIVWFIKKLRDEDDGVDTPERRLQ